LAPSTAEAEDVLPKKVRGPHQVPTQFIKPTWRRGFADATAVWCPRKSIPRNAKYQLVVFTPNYALSQRMDLDIAGVWEHASTIDSTGHAAVAAIRTLAQSSTRMQVTVKPALRHRFSWLERCVLSPKMFD
jgi:hypothetical protein